MKSVNRKYPDFELNLEINLKWNKKQKFLWLIKSRKFLGFWKKMQNKTANKLF